MFNLNRRIKSVLVALFLCTSLYSTVYSSVGYATGTSPLAFAIVPPIQFPPSDFNVTGARVSLGWGNHKTVAGLDFGLLGNSTSLNFAGIAVSGLFNMNFAEATVIGLQAAGLFNHTATKARIYGLQIAAGVNLNGGESTLVGLQVALANISPFTQVTGAQIGLYNKAVTVTGFQIGLVNVTEVLHGIQIGLVNFNAKGLFEVAPLINIGF